MEKFKEFFNKSNFPDKIYNILAGEEGTVEDAITLYEEAIPTVIKQKNSFYSKEEFDTEFSKHRRKLASDINKALGSFKPRNELEKLKWEDFVEEVKTHYATELDAVKTQTDDELKTTLHGLKSEKASLLEQINALEESIESQVQTKSAEYQKKYDELQKKVTFNSIFDKLEWRKDSGHRDKKWIEGEITALYEMHPDGKLTQNGGKQAVNFKGNGHFKTVEEAVVYLYENEQMGPKHKGSDGGGNGAPDGVTIVGNARIPGELSANARKMLESHQSKD